MKNKIMTSAARNLFFSTFFLLGCLWIQAQHLQTREDHSVILTSDSSFLRSLVHHPEKRMVSLDSIPGLMLDLRYASKNNFLQRRLYSKHTTTTYLRQPVYDALRQAAAELASKGYVIVVFDAYRPYSVTKSIWKQVKDERYAANPAKGSGHNRGISVDLTLANIKTKKRLWMPTDFDNFSDSAHQDFMNLQPEQISNRDLLREVLTKYGFIPLKTEWWHFSWPDSGYEVMDLKFTQMRDLQNKY